MRLFGLTPTEFTLLFCTAAILAVIIYLLSFRKRTVMVAADPLWRKIVGKRRTPFRKLLALAIQLLVLFLLSLALGDPRILPGEAKLPVTMALVVDVSAGMGAREQGGTRLDRALELSAGIADAMGPRDRMVLMAMDDSCRPLVPYTSDPDAIKNALAGLQLTTVSEEAQKAVNFAVSTLTGTGFADDAVGRIVLVSDRFHAVQVPPGLELVQVAVGESTENLAVTAFDVRPRGGAARGSEVFLEVANYGQRSRKARLSIHTKKALLGEEVLDVPAAGTVTRSYFLQPLQDDRVMATLTAARGGGPADGFTLDDRAYALTPEQSARRVVLVTEGNLYLEKALSLNPSIDVKVISPAHFRPEALAGAQAVFFDGICPPAPVHAVYFNPAQTSGCPFASDREVRFPALLPLRGDHPVTRGITLIDVQVQQACRLLPEPGDVELLSDEGGPLVIARERDSVRLLGVGFDVSKSDLPLRVAFPILLHNVLDWFLGEAAIGGFNESSVGDLVELPAWVDPREGIEEPTGNRIMPREVGDKLLLRPRVPGYYSAQQRKNQWVLPVNFYQEEESVLAGDRRESDGRVRWRAGEPPGPVVAGFDKAEVPEPPMQWPIILLAVAWLLLFDWIFYVFRILF
jgi:Ca-activated chloride channel family protein